MSAFTLVPATLIYLDTADERPDPPAGTFRICWNDGTARDFADEPALDVYLKSIRCTREGEWRVVDDEGDSIGTVETW